MTDHDSKANAMAGEPSKAEKELPELTLAELREIAGEARTFKVEEVR